MCFTKKGIQKIAATRLIQKVILMTFPPEFIKNLKLTIETAQRNEVEREKMRPLDGLDIVVREKNKLY